MVLPDEHPGKWEGGPHTWAKHAVLMRYMKAWLPILSRGAKARNQRAESVIVDGFAGRGQYRLGEPGSPLILRQIARDVVQNGIADAIELFFIEKSRQNHAELKQLLTADPTIPGVVENEPICAEFAEAAPEILRALRNRPSFWFIDPFGFSGIPLDLIRRILERPRAEVFITLMVRDINRFIEDPLKQPGVAETLGIRMDDLEQAVSKIRSAPRSTAALREVYERQLRLVGGAKYVWPFRVAQAGAGDTIYYLMHGSTHPKALREMKKATYEVGGWSHAFLGEQDVSVTGQLELPTMNELSEDIPLLKRRLLEVFGGREIAYDPRPFDPRNLGLLNEAIPQPQFFKWVDSHVHRACLQLIAEGAATRIAVDSKRKGALRENDRVRFPAARQLAL